MEKTTLEVIGNAAQDDVLEGAEGEIRTLKDLEMLLVGGGSDGSVTW
jgi:hypothetical protein